MAVVEGPWTKLTVADFIRSHGGKSVPTSNIATRFGWDVTEAYRQLIAMEKRGEVVRTGRDSFDTIGASQYWNVPSESDGQG